MNFVKMLAFYRQLGKYLCELLKSCVFYPGFIVRLLRINEVAGCGQHRQKE